MTDVHRHGRFQRFLCWVGLHPMCCIELRGMFAMLVKCVACGRVDMA